jgi:hypothetical protein
MLKLEYLANKIPIGQNKTQAIIIKLPSNM